MKRTNAVQALQSIALLLMSSTASAACTDLSFINPISDVDWDCIFPITIAGIPIDIGNHPPDNQRGGMFCSCPGKGPFGTPLVGIEVSYWEPARLMDTVSDAWCFPSIGVDMGNSSAASSSRHGYSGGGYLKQGYASGESHVFQHYHFYVFAVWEILQMFTDTACERSEGFDLAMVSEVRPDWSDDITAMQLYPETALMANPATVMACVADAVATTVGEPIDALYWCMGSWGLTYPMTGNITAKDYVEANAGDAARALYSLARFGMLPDRAANLCEDVPLPIWVKSHYRIQEVRPVDDWQCHVIGEPGLLWTSGKGPIGRSDNYSWLFFRKVDCCMGLF